MYLGQSTGTAIGKQAGSMAASTIGRFGASYLATLMGAGAAAGPVGIIVGGIISALSSIFGFGPDPKKPVYGVFVIVPEGKLTIKKMLDALRQPTLPFSKYAGVFAFKRDFSVLGTKGALFITSGGLKDTHAQVAKLDWAKLNALTTEMANTFESVLSNMTDEVKHAILETTLSYAKATSYYFAGALSAKRKPGATGPGTEWDSYQLSGGEDADLGQSINQAWKQIPNKINKAFMLHAGIDILKGTIVDEQKAAKAFKPTAASLLSSPISWLAILAGLFFLK